MKLNVADRDNLRKRVKILIPQMKKSEIVKKFLARQKTYSDQLLTITDREHRISELINTLDKNTLELNELKEKLVKMESIHRRVKKN